MPRNNARLSPPEVNFIIKMKEVKYSNREIARRMGISEGAVRYHVKKRDLGMTSDRRRQKPSGLDRYRPFIEHWIAPYLDDEKRPTYKLLHDVLKREHEIRLSYDALRRYMSRHFPDFHKKPVWLRFQTPPGALLFVDWKEDLKVQMGRPGRYVTVQGLVFSLAFSGKMAVVYFTSRDLDSFIAGHQQGFRYLQGLPCFIRPDCLKSAVRKWRGIHSELNQRYLSYLHRLGIEVFPARPGKATDKGKVEKRIRDFFCSIDFKHRVFKDMSDLQGYSNRRLRELESEEWRSSATGLTVTESYVYEKEQLRALPDHFPRLPVRERYIRVRRDGTVAFCNNYYQVGGRYAGRTVLCVNTGSEIHIHLEGRRLESFPYLPQSRGMVMLSEEVIKDPANKVSDQVRRWGLEVAQRQLDYYQEIIRR